MDPGVDRDAVPRGEDAGHHGPDHDRLEGAEAGLGPAHVHLPGDGRDHHAPVGQRVGDLEAHHGAAAGIGADAGVEVGQVGEVGADARARGATFGLEQGDRRGRGEVRDKGLPGDRVEGVAAGRVVRVAPSAEVAPPRRRPEVALGRPGGALLRVEAGQHQHLAVELARQPPAAMALVEQAGEIGQRRLTRLDVGVPLVVAEPADILSDQPQQGHKLAPMKGHRARGTELDEVPHRCTVDGLEQLRAALQQPAHASEQPTQRQPAQPALEHGVGPLIPGATVRQVEVADVRGAVRGDPQQRLIVDRDHQVHRLGAVHAELQLHLLAGPHHPLHLDLGLDDPPRRVHPDRRVGHVDPAATIQVLHVHHRVVAQRAGELQVQPLGLAHQAEGAPGADPVAVADGEQDPRAAVAAVDRPAEPLTGAQRVAVQGQAQGAPAGLAHHAADLAARGPVAALRQHDELVSPRTRERQRGGAVGDGLRGDQLPAHGGPVIHRHPGCPGPAPGSVGAPGGVVGDDPRREVDPVALPR